MNTVKLQTTSLGTKAPILIAIVIAGIIAYFASGDPNAISNRLYFIGFAILFPIAAAYAIYGTMDRGIDGKPIMDVLTLAKMGGLIMMIGFFLYIYSAASATTVTRLNYIILGLMSLIILVGLTLTYSIFINFIKKQDGLFGLIITIIFLLPSYIYDFAEYVYADIQNAPPITLVLFAIEAALILLYIYLPKLSHLFSNRGSVQLQGPLRPLSQTTDITDTKIYKTKTPLGRDSYRNDDYAFSLWLFMNPLMNQIVGEYSVNLFSVGDTFALTVDGSGNNGTTTVFKFNGQPITIPYQKWTNIVINVSNGRADLFVNAELATSIPYGSLTQIGQHSIVTIGDDVHSFLHGSICNVWYYVHALNKFTISQKYNELMNKTPPII